MATSESTSTDGGQSNDQPERNSRLEQIQEKIDAAREGHPDDFDSPLKEALMQSLWLDAGHGGDLQDQLALALAGPREEAPFYLNRAEEEVKTAAERMGVADPGSAAEQTASAAGQTTLTLEVSEPLREWMELEAEECDFDDAEEWAERMLMLRLWNDLHENHEVRDEIEVELPDDLAQRVRLYAADLEARGHGSSLRDIIMDHVQFTHHYTHKGEPVDELAVEEFNPANVGDEE